MFLKKGLAVILSAVMVLAVFAGCGAEMPRSEDSTGTEVININAPEMAEEVVEEVPVSTFGQFYTITSLGAIEIDYPYLENSYNSVNSIAYYDNKIISSNNYCTYNSYTSDDFVGEYTYITDDGTFICVENLVVLSVWDFDLNKSYSVTVPDLDDGNSIYEAYTFKYDDSLWLCCNTSDYDEPFFYEINLVSDYNTAGFSFVSATDFIERYANDSDVDIVEDVADLFSLPEGFYVSGVVSYNKGIVIIGNSADGDYLFFLENDGDYHALSLKDYEIYNDYSYVTNIFDYDENHVVLQCFDDNYVLNTNDYTFEDSASYSANYVFENVVFSTDDTNGYYANSEEGLFYIEPQTKYIECVIDYNYVLGDTTPISNGQMIKIENGDYIFCGFVGDISTNSDYLEVFALSPTENPYEYKQVLKMACASIDQGVIESIKNFNLTNPDYFIEYRLVDGTVPNGTIQPISSNYYYSIGGDTTSYCNTIQYHADIEGNQYSYISNGGFDLLYGFGSNALFDTDRMCLDLNEFFSELNTSNLYTNVLEAKTNSDGTLYQMPLSFAVNSLIIAQYSDNELILNDEYYDENIENITLSDYEELVSIAAEVQGYSEFADPLHAYVCNYECFNQMIDNEFSTFINVNEQSCDFDIDYLSRIYEYVTTYNQEKAYSDIFDDYYFSADYYFEYTQVNSVFDFYPTWYDDMDSFIYLGVPSSNGNRLTAQIVNSLAIYKDTEQVDGCLAFVNYMISDNAKADMDNWAFSINKSVNESKQRAIDFSLFSYYVDPSDVMPLDQSLVLMDNFINQIDGFESKDDIITSVINSCLIDANSKDGDVSAMIESINAAVTSVLERY